MTTNIASLVKETSGLDSDSQGPRNCVITSTLQMISFYEVIDRAFSGRYCSEAEFDMEVLVPKVQEVVSIIRGDFIEEEDPPFERGFLTT